MDTLNSINSQTYKKIEHIVIDGVSTDGTLDLLYSAKSKISKLVTEKDSGIYDALNKGINHSSGDVIGFMHADDVFENEDVLQKVAAAFGNVRWELKGTNPCRRRRRHRPCRPRPAHAAPRTPSST